MIVLAVVVAIAAQLKNANKDIQMGI